MKKIMKGFEGLDYVTVVANVKKSTYGDIIQADPKQLELLVALELVKQRIPIAGQELKVIKSALGLSFETLAEKIDVSKQTLVNWIKAKDKRLSTPYEMAVRVLVAQKCNIILKATFEDLRAGDKVKKIKIDAA